MYNYTLLTVLATSWISFLLLFIYNRTVLVSYSNLTCTFASTQVNATDISAHCDTVSQKRSLNPLYSSILMQFLELIVNNILYNMVEKKCFAMFCQNCQFFGCTPCLNPSCAQQRPAWYTMSYPVTATPSCFFNQHSWRQRR